MPTQPSGLMRVSVPAYELDGFSWTWCRLGDVVRLVPCLHRRYLRSVPGGGEPFSPTGAEMVRRFALVTIPNRHGLGTRYFRYLVDGLNLRGVTIPEDQNTHRTFKLDLNGPYPAGLLVREDWARLVLQLVRRGWTLAIWERLAEAPEVVLQSLTPPRIVALREVLEGL